MKKTILSTLSWMTISVLILAACNLPGGGSGQLESPQAIFTAAAQTIAARVTLEANLTPSNVTKTPTSGLPTSIKTPGVKTSTPTSTSQAPTVATLTLVAPSVTSTATRIPPTKTPLPPTKTPVPPTATNTPIPCNLAQYVRDVTAPDGTLLPPGASFPKIWRLKNIGSCTWTSKYSLVFVEGLAMTKSTTISLGKTVKPGEVTEVGVTLTTPGKEGTFRGEWMMRSADNKKFGIGKDGQTAFWVNVKVVKLGNESYTYNFAAQYCAADWRSKDGALGCARTQGDTSGFNVLLTEPELETRLENELALWVRPDDSKNGFISAQYPFYTIKQGDHFVSQIGCLAGSKDCDVTFQLDYQLSNGTVKNLGSWGEVFDKKARILDIDLSNLTGTAVAFILTVSNNGKWSDANAFWFVPSIRNTPPSTNTPLPTNTPTPTPTLTPTATSAPNTNP